jgi:DNA invertase Pin-like site-specific DNA recombinase
VAHSAGVEEVPLGRVAIYARFSSDKQSDASIEDQVHRARELATRDGFASIEVFTDFAISGASMDRPGMRALQEAIARGEVDTLVTESVDRLSRNSGDAHRFRELLSNNQVGLVCLDGTLLKANDKSALITFGVRALFAEQYRADLADKTLRGLEGRARAGKVTGRLPYGYKPTPDKDIAIVPEQAEVVRRIFREHAAGRSFTATAKSLNAEGIAPPNPGKQQANTAGWATSTIRSVLVQKKYNGTWDFGFTQPKPIGRTGRSLKVQPPRVLSQRPELAIVDQDLWDIVEARFKARPSTFGEARRGYLLSGLLRCAACGSNLVATGATGNRNGRSVRYFGCSAAAKKGTCKAKGCIWVTKLESAIFGTMQRYFDKHRDEIRELVREEIVAFAQEQPDREKAAKKELANVEKQLGRLVEALASTGSGTVAAKIIELEKVAADLRKELGALSAPVLPDVDVITDRVLNLGALLEAEPSVGRLQLQRFLEGEAIYCDSGKNGVDISWGIRPFSLDLNSTRSPTTIAAVSSPSMACARCVSDSPGKSGRSACCSMRRT